LQFGLQASDVALQMGNVEYRQAIMQGLGVGAQVGVALPFSRSHESEADVIGLDLMAKAGFEPTGSVKLWENMNKLSGERPAEFLSTHPAPDTRMQTLNSKMAEAETLKRSAWQKGLKPQCK
jgi:predicted Zn-dependent protease